MIAVGAFAERAHLGPLMVFVFIWATIVYDPIACWTWNSNGWVSVLGGLDFAGGTPVHISSGTAALAISMYLGKRLGYGKEELAYRPHNTTYVVLGTVFLWFGWFGELPLPFNYLRGIITRRQVLTAVQRLALT
jgi:Amt family ammonium transporter